MRKVARLTLAFVAMIGSLPAYAQYQSDGFAGRISAVSTLPQPSDREISELKICVRMTPAQRAQSSNCTDLMARYGLADFNRHQIERGRYITGQGLSELTTRPYFR